MVTYDFTKSKVKFVATVGLNKYFSIGFGSSMVNTDMLIFQATGSGTVTDAYSKDYAAPPPDKIQNLEDISIVIEGGVYTFTCYRDLDTGDSQDYVITLDQEMPLIWAELTTSASMRIHSDRGVSSLTISGTQAKDAKGELTGESVVAVVGSEQEVVKVK